MKAATVGTYWRRGRMLALALGMSAAAVGAWSFVTRDVAPVLAAEETAIEAGPALQATSAEAFSMKKAMAAQRKGRAARVEPKSPGIMNRPTMNLEEYRARKQQYAREAAAAMTLGPVDRVQSRKGYLAREAPLAPAPGPADPAPAAPVGFATSFEGVDDLEACGPFCRPPDPDLAVGPNHLATVTNSNLNIYSKFPFAEVASVRLNNFLGYREQFAFDPRVAYDFWWDRWIVYAEAFPEDDGDQILMVAISQTSNPLGGYWRYIFDVNVFNNDDFWDFGQMGHDQDALIFTANVFGPVDFRGARTFALPKARVYNGFGFSVPLFINLQGTLAPPVVLDSNASTYLLAAPPVSNVVFKYTMRDSSRPNGTSLTLQGIPVPFYTFPANAAQSSTPNVLDTLDGRFQNRSTQIGTSIFQVHTVALGPFPTPRWYQFNGATNTIVQSGFFFSSLTSHDFNPHIAANPFFDVFVVWSSTEPGAFRGAGGRPADIRMAGRRGGEPLGVMGPSVILFTSPTDYELFRWGDYSAVAFDPVAPLRAWSFNEKINNPNAWGTRIGLVQF